MMLPQIAKHLTTDNNRGELSLNDDDATLVRSLSGKTVHELNDLYQGLLVVSGKHKDDVDKSVIYTVKNNYVHTDNIVGFIGIGDDQGKNIELRIHSRFDTNEKQYFFQYMLQRVFCPTILDLKINYNIENIHEPFLAILFPYYLKKAIGQGIFKQYKKFHYNNADVKGAVDVKSHIQKNIPFAGKIAFTTREHSYDNPVTQLIRHTIHFLEYKNWIFDKHLEFRQAVQTIITYTPDFKPQNKNKVIRQNMQRITHPYFNEYESLRKLCINILIGKGASLESQNRNEKIYGIVFDCSWLWEEYLNSILANEGFIHPENKRKINPIHLFENNSGYKRYPDFYSRENTIVFDAKYKRYENWGDDNKNNDIYQIISYMHVLSSKKGGFIFPYKENCEEHIGTLKGMGGDIYKLALAIPECDNFKEFIDSMKENEEQLVILVNGISDRDNQNNIQDKSYAIRMS